MAAKTKPKATKLETSKHAKSPGTLKHAGEKSSLAFKTLSSAKTMKVLESGDVDQLQVLVSEFLELRDTTYSLREYITLDYFVSGLWWCREQSFSAEQTSAFFTIMDLLMKSVEKQATLVDIVLELRQILAETILDGGESAAGNGTTKFFNPDQAKDIIDYFHISLFQHHKLYDCFFQSPPKDFIIGIDMELEIPRPADLPWPAPLGEAIPDEIMKQCFQDNKDDEVVQLEEEEEAGEQQRLDDQLEESLLALMSPEEVKRIITSVYSEMLAGVEEDIAMKIKEKENALIIKINQMHILNRT